jgi:hypothetical protein
LETEAGVAPPLAADRGYPVLGVPLQAVAFELQAMGLPAKKDSAAAPSRRELAVLGDDLALQAAAQETANLVWRLLGVARGSSRARTVLLSVGEVLAVSRRVAVPVLQELARDGAVGLAW